VIEIVDFSEMVLLIIIPTFYGYFMGGIPHFQTYPNGPVEIVDFSQIEHGGSFQFVLCDGLAERVVFTQLLMNVGYSTI